MDGFSGGHFIGAKSHGLVLNIPLLPPSKRFIDLYKCHNKLNCNIVHNISYGFITLEPKNITVAKALSVLIIYHVCTSLSCGI